MTSEITYFVTPKKKSDMKTIDALWDQETIWQRAAGSIECFGTTVYDAMASTIRFIDKMKKAEQCIPFTIVGKGAYDSGSLPVVFEIKYRGKDLVIKAECGWDAQDDYELLEERVEELQEEYESSDEEISFAQYLAENDAEAAAYFVAEREDISTLLSDEEEWTFEEAIDGAHGVGDLGLQDCLGGYIEMSYAEWMESVLK